MKIYEIEQKMEQFAKDLTLQEMSEATVANYRKALKKFLGFCHQNDVDFVTKETLLDYKDFLQSSLKPASCNLMINGLNKFFRMYGDQNCQLHLKTLRLQRKQNLENIFTREEYNLLLETAQKHGYNRCYCVMRLLASTGIRLGEISYVTVKSLKTGIFLLKARVNPDWYIFPMLSAKNSKTTASKRA